jgi:hypothetical protein
VLPAGDRPTRASLISGAPEAEANTPVTLAST